MVVGQNCMTAETTQPETLVTLKTNLKPAFLGIIHIWWLVEMSCFQKCAKFAKSAGPTTQLYCVTYLAHLSCHDFQTTGKQRGKNHCCILLGTSPARGIFNYSGKRSITHIYILLCAACTLSTHICIYIYIVHVYIYTYIHTCIHPSIHPYIHTYKHTHIHTYIHSYTFIYVCMHIYIYNHDTSIYTYITMTH